MNIPSNIQPHLLPDANMSVLDFSTYTIPMVASTTKFPHPDDFLACELPNVDSIDDIRSVPSPPMSIIN
jgi:hypothetical protein